MISQRCKFRRAFTLVELMITILAAVIFIIGISRILAQGHKNYNQMYERVNSDIIRNAYEARRIFDRIVRKATKKSPSDLYSTEELSVYYYSDEVLKDLGVSLPEIPDKYATFYLAGDELRLETGDLEPGTWNPDSSNAVTQTIAYNVHSVEFTVRGISVRMVLTLNNENDEDRKIAPLKMTVSTTAIRHNS